MGNKNCVVELYLDFELLYLEYPSEKNQLAKG